MTSRTQSGSGTSWLRLAAGTLAFSLVAALPARAQTTDGAPGPRLNIQEATRTAVMARSRPAPARHEQSRPPARVGAAGSRSKGERAALTVLGAFGGFIGGGRLGAAIQGDCNCDDPGLMGALIGMPIGAITGGIVAWKLSGR